MTTTDRHFPSLHRVHPRGWLNDPNGIMKVDGGWHVYFQYNPTSARHHLIHWGHMVSEDLVHWTEAPMGPAPTPGGPDQDGCWSGVGVVERDAHGEPVPTAIYSGVDGKNNQLARVVRVPLDRETGAPTEGPTVVAEVPDELPLIGVRDPFLFEYDGRRWALQGAGIREGDGVLPAVLLYSCDDLGEWTYLRTLLTGDDPVAAEHIAAEIWECPQFVPVGDRWYLLVSLWFREEIIDGSTTDVAYVAGTLRTGEDGAPEFLPGDGGMVDLGPDFYAPQAVLDADGGRTLLWGWAREARDRDQALTDEQGWSGALTFPRVLAEVDGRLVARSPQELEALRGDELVPSVDGQGSVLEVEHPYQVELRTEGAFVLELVDADGTVTEVTAYDGTDEATVVVDASMVEILPRASTSRTVRFYSKDGQRLRVRGGVRAAWTLGI